MYNFRQGAVSALTAAAAALLLSGCTVEVEKARSDSMDRRPYPGKDHSHVAPPPAPAQSSNHPFTRPEDWAAAKWQTDRAGQPLNLNGYETIFHDGFSSCNTITSESFQSADLGYNWYAEDTAVGGVAGAMFVSPAGAARKGAPNPIDCSQGHLTLTVSNPTRTPKGWQGAFIKSKSYGGAGFDQTYGYWEVEAMFPPLPQGFIPWASIWVRDRLKTYPIPQTNELDLFESGLVSPTDGAQQMTTIHRFPANPPAPAEDPSHGVILTHKQNIYKWAFNMFDGRHHTYGLKRTHDWQIVYVDRKEVFRFPMTADDMRTPVSLNIDMAVNYPPTAPMTTTYTMNVYRADVYACQPGQCN